jgi:CRP/FNR family transcriptional regulator, cyclic AMP receptor protein
MPIHTKLWYLERFRLLQALSDEQKRQVHQTTLMLELRRGDRAYLPGDPSDQIFLLKSGVIKIAALGPDGRESILAFLHPGDIFGELAVVDEHPRDHLAEAFEDAVICAMSRDLMLRLIQESPDLGYQITKIMGFRLRTFRSRVEELLCKSAAARVAQALLDLAEQHGIADIDGVLIPLRLSQGDLGKLVGLSRETVNGVLQDLRQRGLVEADRRSIRIRQPEALRTVR